MEILSAWLISLQSNPLMLSIFGSTIFGFILYICKDLPVKFYWFVLDIFTIKLQIIEDNNWDAFKCVENEINANKLYYITGRFHLIYKWLTKKLEFSCGENSLFLTKINGVWALISKHTDPCVQLWHLYYYDIRFFTKNKNKIEEFLKQKYIDQDTLAIADEIKVFQWVNGTWDYLIKKKINTPLYYLNEKKNEVIKRIAFFLNNEESYLDKNIPYKEGFIFYGEPGCGKSHFILQLASMFDLNIYYINLMSFQDDKEFIKAVINIKQPSIMLIEDIDCNNPNIDDRNSKSNDKRQQIKETLDNKEETKKTGVTLSTILNIFDGLLSQDGQITVITTNFYDKLDAALTRDGRFNNKLKFEKLTKDEICDYICNFYKLKHSIKKSLKINEISVAELNSICLKNDNVDNLILQLNEKYI